jgi:dTDP-4-amino-4,6-dideoxygalactose transaminase
VVPRDCIHNAHMYYVLLPSLDKRTEVIVRLKERGIQSVFHYVPLHSAPMGRRHGRAVGEMTNTDELSNRLLRLPIWLGLEEQQAFVIQEVIAAAGANQPRQ